MFHGVPYHLCEQLSSDVQDRPVSENEDVQLLRVPTSSSDDSSTPFTFVSGFTGFPEPAFHWGWYPSGRSLGAQGQTSSRTQC